MCIYSLNFPNLWNYDMENKEFYEILLQKNAILNGHYSLGNGFHTDIAYRVNKALQFPPTNRKFAYEIVKHFWDMDVQLVVAARIGAILFAGEIARQLESRVIFTNGLWSSKEVSLYPSLEIHSGDRILIVDDILSEDLSHLRAISRKILTADARLIGIASVIDSTGKHSVLNVRQISVLQIPPAFWSIDQCPLCASAIPIEEYPLRP